MTLVAGQLGVQFLAFITGLLLLRWMSTEDYAQFGTAFGFQTLFASFVDLGFGSSIVNLVGNRGNQPSVIGQYIAAARWWRRLLMFIVVPSGGVFFFLINVRQGWPLSDGIALFACIVASLYIAGWSAWASAPLLIHQRLGHLYQTSIACAFVRLGGCAVLYCSGQLNAVTLVVLNTAVSGVSSWIYWKTAAIYLREPRQSSPLIRRQMQSYLAPMLPTVIFFAVQGQLNTLLISFFGRSQSIAEVTALGRFGHLFTLLGAVYGTLVGPYFARLPRELLSTRYPMAVLGTLSIALGISLSAFVFPEPLLWILGPNYQHLARETGWMVLSSSLAFAGGGIFVIHAARKWIYWSGSFCYIGFVVITQCAFLVAIDLGSTLHVVYMGAATGAAALAALIPVACLGLRRERAAESATSIS